MEHDMVIVCVYAAVCRLPSKNALAIVVNVCGVSLLTNNTLTKTLDFRQYYAFTLDFRWVYFVFRFVGTWMLKILQISGQAVITLS